MLLFLYILITPLISCYHIFPFTDSSKSKINICIGTPCQNINLNIFFSSCVSYIHRPSSNVSSTYNIYKHSQSSTNKVKSPYQYKEDYPLLHYSVIGALHSDILHESQLNFLYIDRYESLTTNIETYYNYIINNKYESLLALCYIANDNLQAFSLLHQMNLKYKVITITNQHIIFGKTDSIIKDYTHYGTCSLINNDYASPNKENQFWECTLLGVSAYIPQSSQLSLFNMKLNNVVMFEYGVNKTYFPIEMLLQFEVEVFRDAIDDDICVFGIKNDVYTFTCNDKILTKEFPNFKLEIGYFIMTINGKELFIYDKINNEYEFGIYAIDSNKKFILGKNILGKYILVYDKTHEYFGMYNKDTISYIKEFNDHNKRIFNDDYYINTIKFIDYNNNECLYLIIIMLIMLMGVSLIYISLTKFYLNKLLNKI